MREFHENRLSDCHALRKGLNELHLYCPYFFYRFKNHFA